MIEESRRIGKGELLDTEGEQIIFHVLWLCQNKPIKYNNNAIIEKNYQALL